MHRNLLFTLVGLLIVAFYVLEARRSRIRPTPSAPDVLQAGEEGGRAFPPPADPTP
jgi:hypothetical protein